MSSFLQDDDRFLRIEEHVKQGNLKCTIAIDKVHVDNLKERWETWWVGKGVNYEGDKWSQARNSYLDQFMTEEIPKFHEEIS